MAGRNVKRGLVYFRMDCDIFQDRKLKRLMRRWQNDGLAVYLALLCEIYRDKGYYVTADDDLIADIADTCLLDDERTTLIYNDCIDLGLFDREILKQQGLLTSKGIQARYLDIMTVLRRKGGIDAALSLISSEENPKIRKDGRKLTKLSEEMHSKPNFHRTMRKLYRKIPKKRLLTPTIEKEKIIKQMIIQKQTYIHIVKNGKGLKGKTKSKTTGRPLPCSTAVGTNSPSTNECISGFVATIRSCWNLNGL